MKYQIIMAAPIRTRSGYGARSRDVAKALLELEYDVGFIATRWGSTPNNVKLPQNIKERIISGKIKDQPDIFIHCSIPNEFSPIGKFNIGLTAGIETTACKPEWIQGCNRMDLVLTSSNHSKNVFEKMTMDRIDNNTGQKVGELKLETPCEVLIEGYDSDIFHKLSKRSELDDYIKKTMKDIDEDFCFLFVGHWLQGALGHDRKDVGMLVHTFIETFRTLPIKKRPALILKTGGSFSRKEKYGLLRKIDEIKDMFRQRGLKGTLPKIYLLYGDLTDEQMNSLYNHPKIKSMVTFTKGEGFGRPLLEFSTTGKPIIATNWSGHTDFLHPEYTYLLPGEVKQVHPSAANEWIIREAGWYYTDYNYAANIMKSLFEHYEGFYKKSRKQIQHSKENFEFGVMMEQLHEYIENREEYSSKPEQVELKLPNLNLLDEEE